ncbi:hypothetical protein LCGC14_1476940 [marine sediment metagenome]|uniref:3'-phosphate/5'-hydroxy nucleic acid ligase n=1 Tax=marine sediment metagenome TaxID=412755 RepID=A0A0F9JAQ0_9ZZZZ
MITLKGKYNFANIFIDKIDDTTRIKIRKFLNHPAFGKCYIAIMPDCHDGVGSCIGFTSTLNDYIIPNIVGVDIGCGISSYCLGMRDIDFKKLDEYIKEKIPMGINVRQNTLVKKELDADLIDDIEDVCAETEQNEERVFKSLGTLGSGNHFIEIGKDEDGFVWLTVHTGSRNFGYTIAKYHQERAKELMKKFFIKENYGNLEFLVRDEDGEEKYLDHMEIAQNYASKNRQLIAQVIIEGFFKEDLENFIGCNFVESVHNYIDLQNDIIRKGAISAGKDEDCVISLNMKDGILLCVGKGSKKWNYSAPHGAGRLFSRREAKETIKLEDYKETMKNVWTSCVNENTLDEAPMAYKDKNVILECIKETVDVITIIKSVYNLKDDTKRGR